MIFLIEQKLGDFLFLLCQAHNIVVRTHKRKSCKTKVTDLSMKWPKSLDQLFRLNCIKTFIGREGYADDSAFYDMKVSIRTTLNGVSELKRNM